MVEGVSLREHLEALHLADQRAVELVREWVQERLESHNGILNAWKQASEADRETFARKESVEALRAEFATYKEITAKALTLAEGRGQGVGATWAIVLAAVSAAGVVGTLVGLWIK